MRLRSSGLDVGFGNEWRMVSDTFCYFHFTNFDQLNVFFKAAIV